MIDRQVLFELLQRHADDMLTPEQSASLQEMLRNDVEARRLFRSYLELDAALARISDSASDLDVLPAWAVDGILVQASSQPPAYARSSEPKSESVGTIQVRRREVIAWMTAAACLLVAGLSLSFRLQDSPRQGADGRVAKIAERPQGIPAPPVPDAKSSVVNLTIAERREQLIASSSDVLQLRLVSENGDAVANESDGDLVWSSGRQMGYLRLRGLTGNVPVQRQYQLWIVGSDVSGNEIINGGIFPVDRSTGELILPIQASQFVYQPKMFVVTVESPGGDGNLTASLLTKMDGLGP